MSRRLDRHVMLVVLGLMTYLLRFPTADTSPWIGVALMTWGLSAITACSCDAVRDEWQRRAEQERSQMPTARVVEKR